MGSNPALRASDSDREAVVHLLGEHTAAGRLTLDEFEERVKAAYEAKLVGDLAGLTRDLPELRAAPPARRRGPTSTGGAAWRGGPWSSWLRVGFICTLIWAATSLAGARLLYFWPIWVVGPWGAALLWRTVVRRSAYR